ncbi:MAG: hypothetical protein JEZ03_14950 [Bacteroidales bacterium]|nr:hypothetical protein [Bacteroidales bacterium]
MIMFQRHRIETRPMTTAHLAQTMKLLNMGVEEIQQQIESELSNNPALEIASVSHCPVCNHSLTEGICPACIRSKGQDSEEPIVFVSQKDYQFSEYDNSQKDDYFENDFKSYDDNLAAFVLKQVGSDLDQNEKKIAAFLLAHLDENGFLDAELFDISRYFHVSLGKIEEVRSQIQRCQPVGVCSFNIQEALLIQLEVLSEYTEVPEIASEIISDHMELLSKVNYQKLAKIYNKPVQTIKELHHFISENLNPFPARSHWGEHTQSNTHVNETYKQPDIIISHLDNNSENALVVEIVLPIYGNLATNKLFKEAIKNASEEKKEEWKKDFGRASLFVKCIQQRNHTMKRLMQQIVKYQRQFIEKGDSYIKPMTRVELSVELDCHESTISRAVSNKKVQLPNNHIIPLSAFFDRSLHIRTALKDIIENEEKPLSDSKLVKKLEEKGYIIARRTVAKYRAMEGILPAHMRKAMANSI